MDDWLQEMGVALRQQKAELQQRLQRVNAHHRRSLDSDSKERATELENQEVVDALGNEAQTEIRQISAALERIRTGDFGVCTECGEPIGRERLAACAHAEKCIECASLDDRKSRNSI